jgi:hypothetical protein
VLGLLSKPALGQLIVPLPQEVVLAGKEHSPVTPSQSFAPQGGVVRVQAVCVQQWPVPVMPQTFEAHSALATQAPFWICGVQVPALQYQPVAQSAVPFAGSQVPSQPVPAALQASSFGHWAGF